MSRKQIRLEAEHDMLIAGFRKRAELLLALFAALTILLMLRLYYIQIICHEAFAAAAKSQYEIMISGFDAEYNFYYVLEKSKVNRELSVILDEAGAKNITKESSKYSVYEMKTQNYALNEKLRSQYGAYIFKNYAYRMNGSSNISGDKIAIPVYADAAGKIIPGISPKIQGQP